jgi:hypothetical protein
MCKDCHYNTYMYIILRQLSADNSSRIVFRINEARSADGPQSASGKRQLTKQTRTPWNPHDFDPSTLCC